MDEIIIKKLIRDIVNYSNMMEKKSTMFELKDDWILEFKKYEKVISKRIEESGGQNDKIKYNYEVIKNFINNNNIISL